MSLSIIIVSFNTKTLTLQCLKLLTDLSAEIIVVDNASTDGTVPALQAQYPHVIIIPNHQNLGFSKACNLGAKQALGEYVLFLNSDTIATPEAILELLIHHSDIATCRLINPNGSLQPQGGYLPNLINLPLWMLNLDHLPILRLALKPYQLRTPDFFREDHLMGWVSGTALMVKKSIYQKLHGFDENLFMYAEDLDFCYRAHQYGFSINYYATPQITHLGQGSGSSRGAILGEYQGLIYYFKKHRPAWQLPVVKFWLTIGALLRAFVFGMIGNDERRQIYQQAVKVV